jgi:hypothetical protein
MTLDQQELKQVGEAETARIRMFERKLFHETSCREDRCRCTPPFPTPDEQRLMDQLGVTVYRKPTTLSASSLPPPSPEQELHVKVAELEERVTRLEEAG